MTRKKWWIFAAVLAAVAGILTLAFFLGDEGSEPQLSLPSTEKTASEPVESTATPSAPPEATERDSTEPSSSTTEEPSTAPSTTEDTTSTTPSTTQPTEPSTTQPTEPSTAPSTEAPSQPPACTISIQCSSVFDHWEELAPGKESVIPESGWMLGTVSVALEEGDTVFDVLRRVTQEYGILMEFSVSPLYNTAYIEGIGNLYEQDCGAGSGWTYAVNGSYPSVGCSDYAVADGDSITWVYICSFN